MFKMPCTCGAFFMQRMGGYAGLMMVKIKIRENSAVARLAAAGMKADRLAIVFGNTIHLHNTSRASFLNDRDWVCHELMHVQQYRQHGFTGFLARYLLDWLRHGYYNNRFEKEARAAEPNRELMKGIEFC